jgi:hypothetical protein
MPESEAPAETNTVDWSADIDRVLAKWCDHAKCFEWMHAEAFSLYDTRARSFMIGINCLTALSGVSNIITGATTVGGFQIAWLFGGISIFVSTLNIVQDKLGYATLAVLHQRLSSHWSTIRMEIEGILMLPYSGRKDCRTFMKFIKNDINTAQKDGSLIPEAIRDACLEKFKIIPKFEIPDICGQMEHTEVQVMPPHLLRSGSIGSALTQQPMVIMDT